MVAPQYRNGFPKIQFDSTYHLTPITRVSFSPAGRPKPQIQDRLTGVTVLYMNYSIIFTEISFYPEASFLL